MSLTVRRFDCQVKDSQTGVMKPAGLLSSDAIGAINSAKETAIAAVQAKGTETLNSIPADYTALDTEVDDLKNALNNSLVGMNIGVVTLEHMNGYYNASSGTFEPDSSTLDATRKFPVVPGMKVKSQATGEKYYCFWDKTGTFISGTRLDTGEMTVPANASVCAIDYLSTQGTQTTVDVKYQIYANTSKNTEDIENLTNEIEAIKTGTVYAKSCEWWWNIYNGGKEYNTSSITGTEKINIAGYKQIKANDISGEKYYVFYDNTNTYISYIRKDTGFADIPSNAKYCGFDFQTSQSAEGVYFTLEKNTTYPDVVCVRNGNDIQIKTKLHNTSKYIGLNASLVNRENEGFNMLKYVITDTEPRPEEIITGTTFKYADDDICPIHYNGSYMGGNHGKEPVYRIASTSHGKTIADIGSVWTDANNKEYVIYKIDDEDKIGIIGNSATETYEKIVTSIPASPLTHVSGATHTYNIVFTAYSVQQLRPITNQKSVKIYNDKHEQLTSDGYIEGSSIDIVETYRIFNVNNVISYLKNHVGSCTNESYYTDSIADDVLVNNVYRFTKGGGCSVCIGITPLNSINLDFFGGVQSGAIGADFFVPYTTYNTITTQEDNTRIDLDSTKWADADFPPYKYYQLSGNNGFAVGYCIDTEQAKPENRKTICAENAGFYYTSKKVYPMFYYNSAHPAVSSGCFCFYAFRAPFIKSGDKIELWYETADATYMEIELFNSWSGIINFPEHVLGKAITVIKKTNSITIPANILNTGNAYIKCRGTGSLTLKFE